MFEAAHQIRSDVVRTEKVARLESGSIPEYDIYKIWSAIWRGRMLILKTTAASLVLTFFFVIVTPRQYTATTQLLVDPSDLRATGTELTSNNRPSDVVVFQVESQARVLASDSVLGRVVADEQLANDPEFAGSSPIRLLIRSFTNIIGLSDRMTTDENVAALDKFRRRVFVKRAERTYVIDVSVTSTVPAKAARLANSIASTYLQGQTQTRANAARQVSQSLSARLRELQDRVRQAEDRVEGFKARKNIVGVNGQLVNEQQITELNKLLEVARYRATEAKARFEQAQHLQQSKGEIGAFAEAVQSPTITALRTQYAEVVRTEAEQATKLGPRHPSLIVAHAQAERLQRMVEEEINRIVLSTRSEYESAKANQEALTRDLEGLKEKAMVTNEALVSLRELERDVQASRAVYEAFLVRARETGEQEQLDTKNIHVITTADAPLNRSWPPSNLILALMALFFGIATGAGIALTRMTRGVGIGSLPIPEGKPAAVPG